ncbi:MAG: sulfotransferase family 2 domain-containing protein [Bacteroidetes bacterium]|nr:sulfotransferase family 2 domain-containing protein [Bacteroidota bacterium]
MITSLIDSKNKIIMDWSPKAGCTILTKMFFRHMGLLEEALQYNPWVHEYRMHVFSKNHPISREDFKNKEFYKFKVVRNPFHRVVSGYIHTMEYETMHEPVKKALWRWNADVSFKSFVKYLSKTDLHTCDPHYALQKKGFEYELTDCYDEIIRLENLNDAINDLNERKNFRFDLSGITSGHHHKKNRDLDKNFSQVRWSHFKDNIPVYQQFYTPQLAEKVFDLYRDDFMSYGYTMEDLTK